jgi:hypothetical protein
VGVTGHTSCAQTSGRELQVYHPCLRILLSVSLQIVFIMLLPAALFDDDAKKARKAADDVLTQARTNHAALTDASNDLHRVMSWIDKSSSHHSQQQEDQRISNGPSGNQYTTSSSHANTQYLLVLNSVIDQLHRLTQVTAKVKESPTWMLFTLRRRIPQSRSFFGECVR